MPNHYGELTPSSRRGAGSGNNFAKHNPAGPHSKGSVQVRRQIGKGCESGGQLYPRNPPKLRLVDLRRLLLNGFFDGGRLSAGQLVLLQLGGFGVADARPRDLRSKTRCPDVHANFSHQAKPRARGPVANLEHPQCAHSQN